MKQLLFIALVLATLLGCEEPDLVRLTKMEDNLYSVNIKLKDGKELTTLVQEITETDSTIVLSKLQVNKEGEPGIVSVVFNKSDLVKFDYEDISEIE